ncbi:MAG: tetratricopeptide repeat protein [Gammaproteobacteria bacterium]
MRRRWVLLLFCCTLAACGAPTDPRAALRAGDPARAAALTRTRAEAGDVSAMTTLGALHYVGVGVPRDYTEALRWTERAALAGDPHAQRNLGSMFRQGNGMPKDDFRAFGWYDQSRRNGNADARNYMEWMALVVGWNQQAYGRRIVAEDLKQQRVTHGEARKPGRR